MRLKCNLCGDEVTGSSLYKPGDRCMRDFWEELNIKSGWVFCPGTIVEVPSAV